MTGVFELRPLSRWLILSVLLLSVASLAKPAYAQISITLEWSAITAPVSGVVTNIVTVSNVDIIPHTVTLSLIGGGWWGWEPFAPNPVVVPPGGSVASTLTVPVPGPDWYCPGESSPGPYGALFRVQGREGGSLLASASFRVYLLPVPFAPTVSVESSKASYMVGETVTLRMNSNVRTQGQVTIKKPDGTTWDKKTVSLPGTYTRTATQPTGTYTAELQAYYCGTWPASASFSVTPDTYDVTVSLQGLPTDVTTALRVDGTKVADMKGGDVRVMSYPIGTTHTLQVDQYVNGAPDYRYYCASNTWTASAEGSITFNYATQVYLDVSTDPSGVTDVTPSGWYASGSSASISAVPAEVEGTKGTKYAFTTWTVDGTPRSGNGFVVVMDAPHKVVAKYDTMFLLTVVSNYGNPKGGGYYKSGDTATFSVDSPVGIGIQQVFVEWKGDYAGKDPKGSVKMDGPKTVTAVWTNNYFQLYIIIGAIAAIAVVAGLLLWMRGRGRPTTMKPPPPPPPAPTEIPETQAEPAAPTSKTEAASKPAVSVALRCTNCGHELKEGQIFCPECGQKQTD